MNRYRTATRLTFALLALLALAGPAAAGEQVPFHGKIEGTLQRTPLDPPVVQDEFSVSGKASHLGRFDLLITAIVNTATRSASGTYEFVAANGDTVTATFVGASAPTATPGVILITETAVITGGTGRFENATGSFVCQRLFDTVNFTTVGSFDGTISSPGANK
jgi:hypothetical protein